MVDEVIGKMISYNGTDVRRINHALKVYAYAKYIGSCEITDLRVLEIIELASILHDIGIHNAEQKYNSNAGPYQEKEGPLVAEPILSECKYEQSIIDRVLFLIGNHHSYNKIDGIDFQILVEADFIVNIFEAELGRDETLSIFERIFKTKTGKSLLSSLYLN